MPLIEPVREYSNKSIVNFSFIFKCIFLLYLKKDTFLAHRALLPVEDLDPQMDHLFFIFKEKRRLQEKGSTQEGKATSDAISFVEGEKYFNDAQHNDRQCCRALMSFWSEVTLTNPDMRTVAELSHQLTISTEKARLSFNKLLQHSPKSSRALFMYASYLEIIVNDNANASIMRERAEHVKMLESGATGRHNATGVSASALDGLSATLAVPVIADPKGRSAGAVLGLITRANNECRNLLGDEVIGRNVDRFLLPPLLQALPEIIKRYLEFGDASHFNRSMKTFVKQSNGDIFPATLYLTLQSSDGIQIELFVSIRRLPMMTSQHFMLIDPSSGRIYLMSNGCYALFQTSPEKVSTATLFVSSLIQGYDNNFREKLEQCGPMGVHGRLKSLRSMDDSGKLQLWLECLNVLEFTVDVITVKDNSNWPQRVADTIEAEAHDETIDSAGIECWESNGGDKLQRDTWRANSDASPMNYNFSPKVSNAASPTAPENWRISRTRAIRQSLLDANSDIDPALVRFRNLLILAMIVVSCAVITFFQLQRSSFNNYMVLKDLAKLASLRCFYAIDIAFNAHTLNLINMGVSLPALITTEKATRKALLDSARNLLRIDHEIYNRRWTGT